jgi:ABC-type sugar transport system ATPase subunit
MTPDFLKIENISKNFDKVEILKEVNASLNAFSTLSILGRSGSGKTTLLKVMAGLIPQDSGSIILGGKSMNDVSPHLRNIVYLYQEDLLFPHLNVYENIAFGLRIKKIPEQEIKSKVEEMIVNLELQGQEHKMPTQISGGQRQRVSFGRAIIINPKLLLLDEPFGSLDVETRNTMQLLFKHLAHQYKITSLFVTHDLKEAYLMGDKLAYMKNGNLKLYQSKEDFIADKSTGMHDEINFWQNLKIMHEP